MSVPRRRDIFEPRLKRPTRPRHRAEAIARGTDSAGRFIGDRDVDRAWQHFWNAPHRRAAAPLARDPGFGGFTTPLGREPALNPAQLRAAHELRRRGYTLDAIAAEFGVARTTIYHHLDKNGGSAALRAAIAAAPVPAVA